MDLRLGDEAHGYDRGWRRRSAWARRAPYERPWVGGYREGFQGGSEGYEVNTTGYLEPDRTILGRGGQSWRDLDTGYAPPGRRRPGGMREGFRGREARYDHELGPRGERGGRVRAWYDHEYAGEWRGGYGRGYDHEHGRDEFRNPGRPEDYHPRFSPIGGTYAPTGGWYAVHPLPRPLINNEVPSRWSRWF
jgi:hypothetical protein